MGLYVSLCVAAQVAGTGRSGSCCKGDHRHEGSKEMPYVFVSFDKLLKDCASRLPATSVW